MHNMHYGHKSNFIITVITLSFRTDRSDQVWANSAAPDQTAPVGEQSDQGLHCLLFHLLHFNKIP